MHTHIITIEGPTISYFLRVMGNKIKRVYNGRLPSITKQDCLDQISLLPQALHPELENAPFAIDHGDPSPLNILIDSDYTVTG